MLEKCCLRLAATTSFGRGEKDIQLLTGLSVGHSSFCRYAQEHQLELPTAKQVVNEVALDGGTVRLRHPDLGEPSYYRNYQAVRLQGMYYGAFFENDLGLSGWVNTQPLAESVVCLGDGHLGVWGRFELIGTSQQRVEILDWYHLNENLHKVGGSLKRLAQIKEHLWQGRVDEAQLLLGECNRKQAKLFSKYLETHRQRIINYDYYQAEQICSIGSGMVESAVKQLGQRLKLPGAQWKPESVSAIASLRCAYLNGLLDL